MRDTEVAVATMVDVAILRPVNNDETSGRKCNLVNLFLLHGKQEMERLSEGGR